MITVSEARRRILAKAKPLGIETVTLKTALGRVLAKPLKARRDQPPFPASAMDGYAVKAGEGPVLKLKGMSAAGHAYTGTVNAGEACRIFTGAPLPKGADAVVIQENTETKGANVEISQPATLGQHVRPRGLDFKADDELLPARVKLNERDLGLAAAGNAAALPVSRRPVVAIFATGDELVQPGGKPRADQIVSSNSTALVAFVTACGGAPLDLGIVRDTPAATRAAIRKARPADILVTTGGASVGDHDCVQQALKDEGVAVDFWKIAMRPGKPFMYGTRHGQRVLGLPGNPVSAMVCARLFLKPLIETLLGLPYAENDTVARLDAPLKANDSREDYVRATLTIDSSGLRTATPFARQDSSMQRTFREAQCLIVRPPNAPTAPAGETVPILILDGS
jgi:molybdopterin molybdotransferase